LSLMTEMAKFEQEVFESVRKIKSEYKHVK
jgi:hypothetical protein